MEATPSQPPGALVEVQSPIVAACELPLLDDVSLLSDGAAALPELVSSVEGGLDVEEPVAESPGC